MKMGHATACAIMDLRLSLAKRHQADPPMVTTAVFPKTAVAPYTEAHPGQCQLMLGIRHVSLEAASYLWNLPTPKEVCNHSRSIGHHHRPNESTK